MFAVINRDVMPRCAMAAFVSGVFLFATSAGGIGHGAERIASDNRADRFSRQASYEDFLPQQRLSRGSVSAIPNTSSRDVASHGQKHSSPLPSKKRIVKITHIVRKGDTLTRISRKYGVTISAIIKQNKIKNANSLKTGARLVIPTVSFSNQSVLKKTAGKIPSGHPRFKWPVRTVIRCRQDGLDGVKPIGIIITGNPGALVFSSAAGIVRKVGHMRGFGHYIVIGHMQRYTTVYSNLGEIDVKEGERLNEGIPIGRIGSGDRELHFQIDHEGKPENPLNYLPTNKKFF